MHRSSKKPVMKKTVLALLLISAIRAVSANENETKVKSDIKEVTVFLNGASVTSVGNALLDSGSNDLVFEDLSPLVDVNSIQAKGEGNFTILAVTFHTNYLNNQPKPKEIKVLEDSLEALQMKIDIQKNIRSVYESEESLLLSNKNIGGANTGVNAAELEKIANILRTRLTEIKSKVLESRIKEKKLNEEIAKVNSQLVELNARRNKNTGEIIVTVSAKAPGSAKILLTYNVFNAGWVPNYDIRATDSSSPIKLDYRANVFQNTGVDWKNVKLTLSTGNPSQSGIKPLLSPWWLSFYNPNNYRYEKPNQKSAPSSARSEDAYNASPRDNESEEVQADYSSSYTEVSEGQTNIQYEITIPYDIPGDSRYHSVSIQTHNLPASYKYYCAPKLDMDAFLLAKITSWDQYNLISGEANIFFEGTFVGKSYLNTLTTSDTLDISLGRDRNVVITRNMLKDFSDKKIIGLNKKETKTFEISVRNKKKQEIEIEIEDLSPLTTNSEIEIELLESSGASYDKTNGKLTWQTKLSPAETKKFKFSYSVKYPKDKVISNL